MTTSQQLFERALQHIPGGVNSPVRAFKAVGGTPVFVDSADGAYLYDCEGKRYIDYVLSWGPMLMGHNHPHVREAVIRQAAKGLSFGTPTELEIQLADRICDIMPGMDLVRMVNSGTEATMSAIRLARGFTGRDTIVKFEGCYHGHSDSLLVKAGSGALTLGVPSSPGVPAALADHTMTLTYNDIDGLRRAFAEHGDGVACIIVEPVAGNMNCIPPQPFTTNHAGTMFGGFFTDATNVSNYQQVMACDGAAFNRFFHLMLEAGVYLAPASYEAGFTSAAHSDDDIEQTLTAARSAFASL